MKKAFLLLATLITAQIHGAQADGQQNGELLVDVSKLNPATIDDIMRLSLALETKVTVRFLDSSNERELYCVQDMSYRDVILLRNECASGPIRIDTDKKYALESLRIDKGNKEVIFMLNGTKP